MAETDGGTKTLSRGARSPVAPQQRKVIKSTGLLASPRLGSGAQRVERRAVPAVREKPDKDSQNTHSEATDGKETKVVSKRSVTTVKSRKSTSSSNRVLGYSELKKREDELSQETAKLSNQLEQAEKLRNEAEKEHEGEINSLKQIITEYEERMQSLQDELNTRDHVVENLQNENDSALSAQKEESAKLRLEMKSLEEALSRSYSALERVGIDPVSHNPLKLPKEDVERESIWIADVQETLGRLKSSVDAKKQQLMNRLSSIRSLSESLEQRTESAAQPTKVTAVDPVAPLSPSPSTTSQRDDDGEHSEASGSHIIPARTISTANSFVMHPTVDIPAEPVVEGDQTHHRELSSPSTSSAVSSEVKSTGYSTSSVSAGEYEGQRPSETVFDAQQRKELAECSRENSVDVYAGAQHHPIDHSSDVASESSEDSAESNHVSFMVNGVSVPLSDITEEHISYMSKDEYERFRRECDQPSD